MLCPNEIQDHSCLLHMPALGRDQSHPPSPPPQLAVLCCRAGELPTYSVGHEQDSALDCGSWFCLLLIQLIT